MDSTSSNRNYIIGNIFLLLIVITVIYISHRYLLPLVWAGIIVISTWPAYTFLQQKLLRGRNTLAASLATLFVGAIIFTPIVLIIIRAISETQALIHYLIQHHNGIAEPANLSSTPFIGKQLHEFWQYYLARPEAVTTLVSDINSLIKSNANNIFSSITVASAIIIKHTISIFFFFLFTFFLYKDGKYLATQINKIGKNLLSNKWNTYFINLPDATRAVVNGTVSVGLIVGILMGLCYYILLGKDAAPILFGFITTILAMIPFGITVAVIIAAIVLIAKGKLYSAIFIIAFGAILTFITDHFVKPKIIGSSTNLPFLMILIGILGGVETLGMIGLFLGPVIMLLMCTLFNQLAGTNTMRN